MTWLWFQSDKCCCCPSRGLQSSLTNLLEDLTHKNGFSVNPPGFDHHWSDQEFNGSGSKPLDASEKPQKSWKVMEEIHVS